MFEIDSYRYFSTMSRDIRWETLLKAVTQLHSQFQYL